MEVKVQEFNPQDIRRLYKPAVSSTKTENGRVTIIGGSNLFHGAPILALKTASRIVDMVFFSSPEPSVGKVAEQIKSQVGAFIWVPFEEVGEYIKKSEAVLIGPGFMRYHKKISNFKFRAAGKAFGDARQISNKLDETGKKTKEITETLLSQFPDKQWVIDGGSLQVMEAKFVPKKAILTPNQREFEMLFGEKPSVGAARKWAKKYYCVIVLKGPETAVCSSENCALIRGGNAGLTKGGTGDILAGLTAALAAKNSPFLAACAASFIVKKAADELYKKVGFAYSADDLAEKIPGVLGEYWR